MNDQDSQKHRAQNPTGRTAAVAQKPKDAATLILIRHDDAIPKVLMGKRSAGHIFMPDKYVFPGGRVEPSDGRAPSSSELTSHCAQLLRYQTRRQPRAFALTAIRETFEETGLIVGKKGTTPRVIPPDWQEYFSTGAIPVLEQLQFVGRAITPPGRPRRFDARFFMADAGKVLFKSDVAHDSHELIDVQWLNLDQAQALDLPTITRIMLSEIAAILEQPSVIRHPPLMRQTRTGYTSDVIVPN